MVRHMFMFKFASTLLLLGPIIALAGGMTQPGEIAEVYVNANWVMARMNGVTDNPDACPSTTYYSLVPGQANYSVLSASLMSAQMTKKRVKFWVSGCGGQGDQYPNIQSIITYTD